MREGFGLLVILGIAYVGWLMFSSKTEKETALFYTWAALIIIGAVGTIYELVIR